LPRKFKTAFSLPHDNCCDILAQCLGFLAITENGQPVGYNLYVGGGQGRTHGKADTFPHLAQPVAFLTPEEVIFAAEQVVKLYRDHGNRSDRKRARIKYLMADWGLDKFRDVLARDYFGRALAAPRHAPITGLDLHHGWQSQRSGHWFLGLSIENGRIHDVEGMQLRTGLRAIIQKFRPSVRITPQQDILLCDVATADRAGIDAMLQSYGIPRPDNLSMVQKWSMACPAIPTCPIAISESERALPGIVDELETTLTSLGLSGEPISVRMTGCPNGCARPYQSEIGIVGRSGDKYTLYIGGDSFGRRLNFVLQDLVPREQLLPKLQTVFAKYKDDRQSGETFGDFCHRVGPDSLRSMVGAPATAH
ncbi:MAG: NADPH-dependent assimilatory sulfite reductase hemoprotein subunit, partial [Gemmataceae bacterium]